MANRRVEVAQAQLADLVAAAEAGGEVVFTRDGEPVARLLPVQGTVALVSMRGPRKPGSARGLVFIRDDYDDPVEDFRTTSDGGLLCAHFWMPMPSCVDRLLVSQAQMEEMPLISADTELDRYGIIRIW